jgi:hypothetical protein
VDLEELARFYGKYDEYADATPMRVPGSRRVETTRVPLGNANCHKHAVQLIDQMFSAKLREHELESASGFWDSLPERPEKVKDKKGAWAYQCLKFFNRSTNTFHTQSWQGWCCFEGDVGVHDKCKAVRHLSIAAEGRYCYNRLPMLKAFMRSNDQTWRKQRTIFSEVLSKQVEPCFEAFCSDVRLIAYAHHAWENMLVRSSEGDVAKHILFLVGVMETAERFLADHSAMINHFFRTVDVLDDRRYVFERLCAAQKLTMKTADMETFLKGGGLMSWQWLETYGARELNNDERKSETAKALDAVESRRRMRKALCGWREVADRKAGADAHNSSAHLRTLTPEEEERLALLFKAMLQKGKEFLCRELTPGTAELVYTLLKSMAKMHNFEPEDIFCWLRRILENAQSKRMELCACEAKVGLSKRYNERDHDDARFTGWGSLEFTGDWEADFERALLDDNDDCRLPPLLLQHKEGFQRLCESMLARARNLDEHEFKSRTLKRLMKQARSFRTEAGYQQDSDDALAARLAKIQKAKEALGPKINGKNLPAGEMLTHLHDPTDEDLMKMTSAQFSNQMRLRWLRFQEMGGAPPELLRAYANTGPGMFSGVPAAAPRDNVLFFASDCLNGGGAQIAYDVLLKMKPAQGSPRGTLGPMADMYKNCVLAAEIAAEFPSKARRRRRATQRLVEGRGGSAAAAAAAAPKQKGKRAAAKGRKRPAQKQTTAAAAPAPAAAAAAATSVMDVDEEHELLASDDEATKAEEAELLGLEAKASPAPGTPPRQPLTAASNQANGGSPPVAMQLSGDEGDEDL